MDTIQICLKYITGGFDEISSAVNIMFRKFQIAVDTIIPKLEVEERQQFDVAFKLYLEFLMNTQEFISNTSFKVKYAENLQQLCNAVRVDLLQHLIDAVKSLLEKFRELEGIVKRKFPQDEKLQSFRNLMIGVCTLGVAFVIIGTGIGVVAGFTIATHSIIGLGVTASVIGGGGAGVTQMAIRCSDIGMILKTLDEIQKCLHEIAQVKANMLGITTALNSLSEYTVEQKIKILNDERNECLNILKKTQAEVTEGFKILKRM